MANADTPYGLRAVGHPRGLSGARVRAYHVPASYGTALFPGDPVVKTGTANTAAVSAPGAGDFPIGTLAEVNKATAGDGNAITGVIVAVAADPDALGRRYIPASTGGVVFVNDDPQTEFEIQADGAIAAAQVGLNAVLIYTNAGDTNTGQSGAELDTTSDVPAADASNQLTILRVINRADNEAGSAFTKCLVRINNHTEAHGAIGI
ncbi:hypothetical protein N6L27_03485 [Leisingera sp. SS27]|uniref:hypothetical protein n=1 Tax=Leisingera sp. SS27 TaxID=2979462 RepID=UPI00232FFF03|nr:hypothetical protein [Leisingera sp. SS27]MDC0657053.1 hypothetical protein [Leisingera sp. SS27]